GIRDLTVTGVQTCALPISPPVSDGTGRLEFAAFPVKSMTMTSGGGGIFGFRRSVGLWLARAVVPIAIQIAPASAQMFSDHPPPRSEERRVGKECRSRGRRG